MHKRAVHDVSSSFRHIFRRYKTGPTLSKSKSKPSKSSFAQQKEKDEQLPVSQQLRTVIRPEVCEWLEGKPMVHKKKTTPGHEPALLPTQSSSMEKAMFDSLDTFEDVSALPGDDMAVATDEHRIPAGSLVEIRRSEFAMNGVVLYSLLVGRRWSVYTLTRDGEVWQHHEHDVTFEVPNLVSRKLAEECGMGPSAVTESEYNARVDVLKTLRTYEKRLEYHSHSIPEVARSVSFYDVVAHPDSKTWTSVSLRDAAAKLYGKPFLSTEELLAVQTYLFNSGLHFLPESRRYLQRPSFWIRPRQEVSDIEAVTKMVLQRSSALDAFIAKARKVVVASRQRAADGWNEPPSRRPLDGVDWTEEDRTILRFFVASVQSRRIIQRDPFIVPVAHILKTLGLYSVEEYETTTAHTFLLEMGVLAPWEELNTRDVLARVDATYLDLVPPVSTPIIPSPLGLNDLYSHDVVESIRHDFGDLPVYVVDDWDAEELDDGVSVERIPSDPEHTWLHVHVADPTALLPPTHHLARHAMQISSAKYWVDRTIPMLPREAGFHQFSLGGKPGKPDFVLTFSAKVNSAGQIVDYKIQPSIVRNVRTIKYGEVDALLGVASGVMTFPFAQPGPSDAHPITPVADLAMIEDFRLLHQVTQYLNTWRVKQGGLVFSFPIPEIKVEPRPLPRELMAGNGPSIFRGFPQMTYSVWNSSDEGSRDIIAECMKTAGRVASYFFRDRGIPALRRTVGPLRSELRDGIERVMAQRTAGGYVDVFSALRERISAPSGRYSTKPDMHSLMGIPEGEGYIKITSPLRRFGDLLAHWQIKHALLAARGERTSPVLFDEHWMVQMAEDLGVRELNDKRTEGIQRTFWSHTFLLRWINDPARDQRVHDPLRRPLKARIIEYPTYHTRKNEWFVQVHVPELALSGRLSGWSAEDGRTFGEEVDVQIASISLGTRPILDFKLHR